jgi:hypothetical protein
MSWRVTAVSTALVAFVCAGASRAASEGVTSSGAASIEVVAKRGVVGFRYDQSLDEPAPARIAVHVPDGFHFIPNAKGAPIGSVVGSDIFFLRGRCAATGHGCVDDR